MTAIDAGTHALRCTVWTAPDQTPGCCDDPAPDGCPVCERPPAWLIGGIGACDEHLAVVLRHACDTADGFTPPTPTPITSGSAR